MQIVCKLIREDGKNADVGNLLKAANAELCHIDIRAEQDDTRRDAKQYLETTSMLTSRFWFKRSANMPSMHFIYRTNSIFDL